MVVVADLVARVRAEGVQETAAAVKAVGQNAQETARALEIMAQAAAKANPNQGAAGQILEVFQKANVQPTAAALSQARAEMEKLAAASTQAVQPSQAVARAAREHVEAAANGARAAQNVAEGWKLSESSLVRFGAGLAGIGLGFSLVAGAARLIHDAVEGIVTRQLDWERSLRTLSGLYGQAGAQAAAVATAQANLPGVLGTQQEFAQAGINASGLRLRYGLSQETIDTLTTTGGRLAFATGMTDPAQRAQLQAQILAAVSTGESLPPQYGVYTDPEAVARRLGFQGAASLQTFTPQELMEARAAIVNEGGSQFADRAQANQRAALDAATAAAKVVDTASSNLTNLLENGARPNLEQSPTADIAYQQAYGDEQLRQRRAALGLPEVAAPSLPAAAAPDTTAALQGNAEDSLRALTNAQITYTQSLADSARVQEQAQRSVESLAHSVDAAGARVLTFFGSLEDATSIAHGDLLAQAQASLTARQRSAVPAFGTTNAEVNSQARGTTYQQVWQNYVAELAQGEGTNPIERNLQVLANQEGPGLEPQRRAAQRALEQAPRIEEVNRGLGAAQRQGALVDLSTAQTQAQLEAISLTQRERQIALLHETIDLRRLDLQQQQAGLRATEDVIHAQQAALPVQAVSSAARYQQTLAQAVSLQRMARLLQGRDVSDLPTVDQLIQQNYQGQLAEAENAPSAARAGRGIEVAQQNSSGIALAQALTEISLREKEISVEMKNLEDLPQQLALEAELVQNNRDQLSVQTEMREYLKALVYYMTQAGVPPRPVPADRNDRIDASNAPRAPSELAGARR